MGADRDGEKHPFLISERNGQADLLLYFCFSFFSNDFNGKVCLSRLEYCGGFLDRSNEFLLRKKQQNKRVFFFPFFFFCLCNFVQKNCGHLLRLTW